MDNVTYCRVCHNNQPHFGADECIPCIVQDYLNGGEDFEADREFYEARPRHDAFWIPVAREYQIVKAERDKAAVERAIENFRASLDFDAYMRELAGV